MLSNKAFPVGFWERPSHRIVRLRTASLIKEKIAWLPTVHGGDSPTTWLSLPSHTGPLFFTPQVPHDGSAVLTVVLMGILLPVLATDTFLDKVSASKPKPLSYGPFTPFAETLRHTVGFATSLWTLGNPFTLLSAPAHLWVLCPSTATFVPVCLNSVPARCTPHVSSSKRVAFRLKPTSPCHTATSCKPPYLSHAAVILLLFSWFFISNSVRLNILT